MFVSSGVERDGCGPSGRAPAQRRVAPPRRAGEQDGGVAAADREDRLAGLLDEMGQEGWRLAEPLARAGSRQGVARRGGGRRRPRDRRGARVGGRLDRRPQPGGRAAREHRAHLRARRCDQGLHPHGPGGGRGRRRARRHREHAHHPGPPAQAGPHRRRAALRPVAAVRDRARVRPEPGVDEPDCKRARCPGRRGHHHDHHPPGPAGA